MTALTVSLPMSVTHNTYFAPCDPCDPCDPPSNFGIYRLKTPDLDQPTNTDTDWILTVDRSGSMGAPTGDRRSRMDHVKHMVKNFIDYLKTHPNTTNTMTLLIFDHECHVLCECIEINATQDFEDFIKELDPRGMTDMGEALSTAKSIRDRLTNSTVHILLTDGQITQGDTSASKLIERICGSPRAPTPHVMGKNIFIGFGADHNSDILEELAEGVPRGTYYFVESFENAGLAYGEVIHDHLYEYARNITITVHNGEIYNYKTNTWGEGLTVASLAGGCTKTYHIRYFDNNSLDDLRITTTMTLIEDNPRISTNQSSAQEISYHIAKHGLVQSEERQKYWFRQQTQELLYKTKQHIEEVERNTHTTPLDCDTCETRIQLNERLTTFIETMKNYMTANNLVDDPFMKNLCDDIHTAIISLNSTNRRGSMYIGSRQTSQGTQRGYSTCDLTGLQRQDAQDTHIMSQDNQSIYTPLRCADIMRSVSEVSPPPSQASTPATWVPPQPYLQRSSANQIYITPLLGAQITKSVTNRSEEASTQV